MNALTPHGFTRGAPWPDHGLGNGAGGSFVVGEATGPVSGSGHISPCSEPSRPASKLPRRLACVPAPVFVVR